MKSIVSARVVLALGLLAPLSLACGPTRTSSQPAVATTTAAALDGRTFVVEGDVPPSANLAPTIELSFAGGMLDSSACRQQGLPPVAYTTHPDGTFYAERRSGDAFDTWTGRVTGERIEGTFVAQKAGAVTMRIPFRGHVR